MFNPLITSIAPASEDREPLDPEIYRQVHSENYQEILRLLPIASVELAADDRQVIQTYQMASLVLGPAASAPMMCAGPGCPDAFRLPCPLAQRAIEPVGSRCPFEQNYVSERFTAWLQELGRTLQDILESERSAITTLVILDLQERRCAAILAQAENAQLTHQNVSDVDIQTGTPLSWEDVIHANASRIDQIIDKRRAILRDLELTPEMKTKRAKAMGTLKGGMKNTSFASSQSARSDLVRRALRGEAPQVVDIG